MKIPLALKKYTNVFFYISMRIYRQTCYPYVNLKEIKTILGTYMDMGISWMFMFFTIYTIIHNANEQFNENSFYGEYERQ